MKVVVGKKVMSDKINFIVDKQNAVFGRVFELPALLPYDNKLTISVMDHDYLSVDDVIGMYIADTLISSYNTRIMYVLED